MYKIWNVSNLLGRLIREILSRINKIYYIGGPEALPPPLSAVEENELLERLKSGENEVKSELIERNLRLVVYIAKKFENTGINIEDLISIGTIGLIKAVNTFDPNKK
jgi:RNA polymerase, sigma 29 subunit, SigE